MVDAGAHSALILMLADVAMTFHGTLRAGNKGHDYVWGLRPTAVYNRIFAMLPICHDYASFYAMSAIDIAFHFSKFPTCLYEKKPL